MSRNTETKDDLMETEEVYVPETVEELFEDSLEAINEAIRSNLGWLNLPTESKASEALYLRISDALEDLFKEFLPAEMPRMISKD